MNATKLLLAIKGRLVISRNNSKKCILCGHRVNAFIPYFSSSRKLLTLPRVLHGVGSDIHNFECPWCGAHDRERHLFLYMKKVSLIDKLSEMDILHFAPERMLSNIFEGLSPRKYIKCDLYPKSKKIEQVDMLAMPYPEKSFDLLIANHILEHVADDKQAVREVYRVLRPGGYAILQTPYSLKLCQTWSDPGVDSAQAKLLAYGQEDHVRIFGKDVFKRITSTGLVSEVSSHEELLPEFDAKIYGVNIEEPFFLFKRPIK